MRTNPLHSSDYELRAFSSVTGNDFINTYTIPRGKRAMVQNSFLAVVSTEPLNYVKNEIASVHQARPLSITNLHWRLNEGSTEDFDWRFEGTKNSRVLFG